MNVICTSECEECIYGMIDESNKARVKVNCQKRYKTYWYGQMIECEDKEKKK